MGIFDGVGKSFGQAFAATLETRSSKANNRYGAILAACAILPVFAPDIWMAIIGPGAAMWPAGERVLRWTLSLAPAAVIFHHALDLLYLRQHEFPIHPAGGGATPPAGLRLDIPTLQELKELYFGGGSIAIKYGIPLVLSGFLCSISLAALLDLRTFSSWLPGTMAEATVHRAAAFGFAGAYLYVILLLTQRAFLRDVTPGVALWIAAMFITGPLMAGVFSLFWNPNPSTQGAPTTGFGIDVVYLVAGMLPRQFASIAQGMARRLLQPSAAAPTPGRMIPLSTVRGINAEVEERLSEEGIYDVATLAYADAYLLLRSTSFDRRQIVNWIDEAMLIQVFPEHWQALEKNGFTGAMDVAATTNDDFMKTVESDLKMTKGMMKETQQRLTADAQIQDLFNLYWNVKNKEITNVQAATTPQTAPQRLSLGPTNGDLQPVAFSLDEGTTDEEQTSIVGRIRELPGVRTIERVDSSPRMWRAYVPASQASALSDRLMSIAHVHVEQTH